MSSPSPGLFACGTDGASADLDGAYYRRRRFDSVHVGDFVLAASSPAAATLDPPRCSDDVPRVSVLACVKDGAKTVAAAVRSALDEGPVVAEVVVVDDGSEDGTLDILEDLARADDRVKVVRRPATGGVAAALNDGLRRVAADADYVARLDADDVVVPGRVRRQADFLRAHPDVAFVGAGALAFSDDDDDVRPPRYVGHPTCPHLVAWHLNVSCVVAHPTVLCRADALRTLRGYDVAAGVAEDYDLWLRAVDAGYAVANVSDPLLWLRKSAASVSSTRSTQMRRDADAAVHRHCVRALQKHVSEAAVAALRRPQDVQAADAADAAADLLLDLEADCLAALGASTTDDARSRAAAVVRADVVARLNELHVAAMKLGHLSPHWARRTTAGDKATALRALCGL